MKRKMKKRKTKKKRKRRRRRKRKQEEEDEVWKEVEEYIISWEPERKRSSTSIAKREPGE